MKSHRYTMAVYGSLPPINASNWLYGLTLPHPCLLQGWRQAVNVTAPNDASNYWSVELHSLSGTLATFTTIGLTAGAWNLKALSNLNKLVADSAVALYVYATKVGSPGTLFTMAPVIHVE